MTDRLRLFAIVTTGACGLTTMGAIALGRTIDPMYVFLLGAVLFASAIGRLTD